MPRCGKLKNRAEDPKLVKASNHPLDSKYFCLLNCFRFQISHQTLNYGILVVFLPSLTIKSGDNHDNLLKVIIKIYSKTILFYLFHFLFFLLRLNTLPFRKFQYPNHHSQCSSTTYPTLHWNKINTASQVSITVIYIPPKSLFPLKIQVTSIKI